MPYLLNEFFTSSDIRDLSKWILVGEVENPIYPEKEGNVSYIFVSPDIANYDGPDWRFKDDCVRISSKPDGTGIQGGYSDIMSYYRSYIKIYPEHLNDEYGDVILGKRKSSEVLKSEHDAFLGKLNLRGNDVVLKHNSSIVIRDGVVKKGKTSRYSNNSDIGIYFWGSKDIAADPSNGGMYTYFCHIPLSELYDFDTNEERLTLKQAINMHSYVGQTWNQNNPNVIVVNTYRETPIDYILEKRTGKYYNAQWEEIKIKENKNKLNKKMLIEGKIRKFVRESVRKILSEEIYRKQWEDEKEKFFKGLRNGTAEVEANCVWVPYNASTFDNDFRCIYYKFGDDRLSDDHFCVQHSPQLDYYELLEIKNYVERFGGEMEIPETALPYDELYDEDYQ